MNKDNMNDNNQGKKLSVCFPTVRQEFISTDWNSLDKRLGGLRNGEVIVVSGYSNMGKTTFVTLIKNISIVQWRAKVL